MIQQKKEKTGLQWPQRHWLNDNALIDALLVQMSWVGTVTCTLNMIPSALALSVDGPVGTGFDISSNSFAVEVMFSCVLSYPVGRARSGGQRHTALSAPCQHASPYRRSPRPSPSRNQDYSPCRTAVRAYPFQATWCPCFGK